MKKNLLDKIIYFHSDMKQRNNLLVKAAKSIEDQPKENKISENVPFLGTNLRKIRKMDSPEKSRKIKFIEENDGEL